MPTHYLSYHQERALETLRDGGRILTFESGGGALVTVDGDDLSFRFTTFSVLKRFLLIKKVCSLAIGVDEWGLTEKGIELINS